MRRSVWLVVLVIVVLVGVYGVLRQPDEVGSPGDNVETPEPPEEVPEGILVDEIPVGADLIFVSIRYVLDDLACLDEEYRLKADWLGDAECIKLIYSEDFSIVSSPRQLFTLDIETGEVVQLINVGYDFSSSKPIDMTRIMAIGAEEDTDGDGIVGTGDEVNIYVVDLASKEIECLTDGLGLRELNNPDYLQANGLIVFSAQRQELFHNYLFTLSLDGELTQVTDDDEYFDFDCSWSEDGSMIVFNRLPSPVSSSLLPSKVWLMDADGSNMVQISEGGSNPDDEGPHMGMHPIGLDADPDLSPDNSQVVFSRLRTGLMNEPFGIYDLVIRDIESGEETVLDSSYANMVPEWKSQGIVFVRQKKIGDRAVDLKQSIHVYIDGELRDLEPYPFNVFPIGSNGASWVE
jgi:hypothetical protein